MKTLNGKVAAITGAGSGIGRATAALFARNGCNVALSDVNEQGLRETADQCRSLGVRVHETRVDVAQREAVHAWADAVARELGSVNVIVNNAGVALGATIEDTKYEDFEWLMNINFYGVVPLYEDEMDFKLEKGTEALFDLFDEHEVTELVAPDRPSVVPHRRGLFRS